MKYLFLIILIVIFSGTELVFAANDKNNVDTDTANLAQSEGGKGEYPDQQLNRSIPSDESSFKLALKLKKSSKQKDIEKAIELFQKCADSGSAQAQYELAKIYYTGEGVEKNDETAFKWFLKSAEQGYAKAQYSTAVMYAYNLGTKRNTEKALKFYRLSAENGYAKGQVAMSKLYSAGRYVKKDLAESLRLLQLAVDQEDAEAEYLLGLRYLFGRGVEKNIEKGVELLKKSAEQEYAVSEYWLGRLFYDGEECRQDFSEALKWLQRAGSHGEKDAYELIGVIYYFGKGVPANQETALQYFMKSEDGDIGQAEYRLGVIHYYGLWDVEEDDRQALEWFEKASKHNCISANYRLGRIYDFGRGVEEDESKAYSYYKKAADQGHFRALQEVSIRSFMGDGTEINAQDTIKYGEKYADLYKDSAKFSDNSFIDKLREELFVTIVGLAYLKNNQGELIIPFMQKVCFPIYIILITALVVSIPFFILIGILIFIKIRFHHKAKRKENWTLGDAIFSLCLFILLSAVFSVFVFLPIPFISGTIKVILFQSFAGIITVSFFILLAKKREWNIKEKFTLRIISPKRSFFWIGGALIINFLFEYCYDFILEFFKVHKDPQVIVEIIPDASSGFFSLLFFVLAIAIIIPVLEEIIFRVILYQGLKSKLPLSFAILITSLIFALIHIQTITLFPIFVMGFLLTYSYEKTQSLFIPVTIHCINNFLGVCLMLASR